RLHAGDRPRLHHRLADVPDAVDLLGLVDRFRHRPQHGLALKLVFIVPSTLLGHGTTTRRGSSSITGRLCRVLGHPQPQGEDRERCRQKFAHRQSLLSEHSRLSWRNSEAAPLKPPASARIRLTHRYSSVTREAALQEDYLDFP